MIGKCVDCKHLDYKDDKVMGEAVWWGALIGSCFMPVIGTAIGAVIGLTMMSEERQEIRKYNRMLEDKREIISNLTLEGEPCGKCKHFSGIYHDVYDGVCCLNPIPESVHISNWCGQFEED